MVSRLRSDDEEGWDVLIRAFKLFVTMTHCKADAESGKAKLMLKPKTVFVNTKDDLASISFEVESVTEYQIKEKPDGKIRTSVLMQFYSDGSYSTIRAMVTETGMVEQVEWSPASGFVAVITQGIQETAREKAILTLNGSWSKIKTKLAVNSTEQLKECMVKIEPAIKIVQVIYLIRHLKKSRLFKAEYRQKVADIIETLLYREMSKCNQEKPVKELMEMAPKDLLPEQEEVIRTVLKGNFRVFEIQGVAGSGKTFTICELIKLEFLRMQAEWQAQDDADDDDDLEEQLGDEIAELEEIRQLAAKDDQVLTPEELAQIRQARVQAFSILDARFAKKMGKFGGIPLLVAVTNAAVLTLVEKLLTMTVPPLCLLSLSATTMARRKNAAIIEMCSIEAHCQRLLRAKQLSTAEQFILQDAIAIQEKLERKTKKIVAENDFDQIDPTEEDDMLDFDWENLENETEKPETMASAEKKSAEGSDQETLQWH
uniref:DNA helicase n=1 Tax=Panagrolaimus sp. JU765 TaxID=591449 RepID=A0AC34QUF9_9BILA